jgi:hypothetical protein
MRLMFQHTSQVVDVDIETVAKQSTALTAWPLIGTLA